MKTIRVYFRTANSGDIRQHAASDHAPTPNEDGLPLCGVGAGVDGYIRDHILDVPDFPGPRADIRDLIRVAAAKDIHCKRCLKLWLDSRGGR